MNKLLLIIKREYLTRVKRRSFILATILTPLAFAVFFVVVGFIFQYQSDDKKKIAVLDEANILNKVLKDESNLYFNFPNQDLDALKADFDNSEFDGILVIPAMKDMLSKRHLIYYYSDEQLSLDIEMLLRSRIADAIRDYKIDALKLERKQLDALETRVELEPEPIEDTGEDATSMTGAIAAGIGMIMGFVMYFTVFIYGMMVMRSVMEEKTNRIVEVMISSVKPFQLMLGKLIGVGGVGLTQIAIWAILLPIIIFVANLFFGFDSFSSGAIDNDLASQIDPDDLEAKVGLMVNEISNQNWWTILPLFVFYFIGGYFLYASLFAAVGSAMGDDLGEGQALTIPITIPVVLAVYIMIVAVQAPNSTLAVWSSIFPLFSPIVMPARLAFDPPLWEVVVSVLTLALGSLFFVWLSGRIYRVGILLYGKKVSFREIGRWIFSRD